MSILKKAAKVKHYLGIDWGKSRVGLALADEETRIAFAYTTLENDKNLLQKLAEIITRENIETAVIGIPFYVNRKEVEYEGEKLGVIIKDALGIEIYYQNEMFTTKMAQQGLIERGVKKIKRYDDQESARIILQEWLDKLDKRENLELKN